MEREEEEIWTVPSGYLYVIYEVPCRTMLSSHSSFLTHFAHHKLFEHPHVNMVERSESSQTCFSSLNHLSQGKVDNTKDTSVLDM